MAFIKIDGIAWIVENRTAIVPVVERIAEDLLIS